MRVHKSTEYAIQILHYLHQDTIHRAERFTTQMISDALRITYPLANNIMAKLRRNGLITSVRGRNGGYRVARPVHQINLYDVVLAMEGELKINYPLGASNIQEQSAEPCALQEYYKEVGESLANKLANKSIADFNPS